MRAKLGCAEELLLLMLDDASGTIVVSSDDALRFALAGAVTLDLAFCAAYYPDLERFDIDRFLPERAEHRAPGVYAPFGLGAHRCIGAGFAEAQIQANLAALFHQKPEMSQAADSDQGQHPDLDCGVCLRRESGAVRGQERHDDGQGKHRHPAA